MEIGEKIFVNTQGDQKIGSFDRTTVHDSANQEKFIILLDEGDTLEDGEHFMCEFEPAALPHSSTEKSDPDNYYLKLNRGNGY